MAEEKEIKDVEAKPKKRPPRKEKKKEEVVEKPKLIEEPKVVEVPRVVEEPKREIIIQKKSNTLLLLLLTIIVLALTVIVVYGAYYFYKQYRKDNRPAAELKYTETVEANKNVDGGIFITDVSGVVDKAMPSIVAITSKTLVTSGKYGPSYFGGSDYQTGAGSGIIISQTDDEILILTNNHVVDGAKELSVQFINEMSYDATIKGTSSTKDIAVIAVKKKDVDTDTLEKIRIATLGDSSKVKVGEGVIAIGNSLGYGQSVTTGVISAVNRNVTIDSTTRKMIQTDAPINGGNSGGALLNSRGEVIGINSAKYSSRVLSEASIEGMGFAIPITDVQDTVNLLMEGKSDEEEIIDKERGYLGITGYMVTEDMQKNYGMPKGVYIQEINEKSKAASAGLRVGYIITKINGKEVEEFETITNILSNKKPGDTVKLTVKYGDEVGYKETEVVVELSKYDDIK